MDNGKPHPGSFADRFCREKGIKYFGLGRFIHSAAGIADSEPTIIPWREVIVTRAYGVAGQGYADSTCSVDGIGGICNEIGHYLMDFCCVTQSRKGMLGDVAGDLNR